MKSNLTSIWNYSSTSYGIMIIIREPVQRISIMVHPGIQCVEGSVSVKIKLTKIFSVQTESNHCFSMFTFCPAWEYLGLDSSYYV